MAIFVTRVSERIRLVDGAYLTVEIGGVGPFPNAGDECKGYGKNENEAYHDILTAILYKNHIRFTNVKKV